MLLIVTAQKVHESAQRDGTVAFEGRRAARSWPHRDARSSAIVSARARREAREHLRDIRRAVVARFAIGSLSIDGRNGVVFVERAAEA